MHMFMASMGASPDHELLDVVDGVDVLHAVLHDLAGRFQALHSKAGKTPRLERHQGNGGEWYSKGKHTAEWSK